MSEQLQDEYRPVFTAIADLPVPVIAAIPGSAAGIGMSLALQCDLVIMAEDAFLLSPFLDDFACSRRWPELDARPAPRLQARFSTQYRS